MGQEKTVIKMLTILSKRRELGRKLNFKIKVASCNVLCVGKKLFFWFLTLVSLIQMKKKSRNSELSEDLKTKISKQLHPSGYTFSPDTLDIL